jgi:hypothetical protein
MKNRNELSIADLIATIQYLAAAEQNSFQDQRILELSIQRQELEDLLQDRLLEFGIEF